MMFIIIIVTIAIVTAAIGLSVHVATTRTSLPTTHTVFNTARAMT